MSIYIKCAGRSIWNPSSAVGFCFVDQIRSLEKMLAFESGVSPSINDEVDINLAIFEDFVSAALDRLERTNHGELFALTAGCLQICIALNWKMGGKLPPVSPKLKPLLEGANFFQKQNWRVTVLEPSAEETDARAGELRDMRDVVVYHRKKTG